jgi:hypothetical protein
MTPDGQFLVQRGGAVYRLRKGDPTPLPEPDP